MGSRKKEENKAASTKDSMAGSTGAPAIWNLTRKDLKGLVSSSDFDRYISELKIIAERDGKIIIAARTRLTADRVRGEHQRLLQRVWRSHDPRDRIIDVIAWDRDGADYSELLGNDPWAEDVVPDAHKTEARPANESTISGERRDYTFDNLVVGPFNQTAYDLVRHIADDGELPANVILIYGLQGVGKTHMITALQQHVEQAEDTREIFYITAEDFQNEYIAGAMARDTRELKAKLRACDIVLIDDLQNIANAKGTDAEFCRNLRSITEAGGLVILTTDTAPGKLDGFSTRVMSQIRGAMSVEIKAPDKAVRLKILRRFVDRLQAQRPAFEVSDAMLEQINQRIRGQGRELLGGLLGLYSECSLGTLAPTQDMLARVLDKLAGAVTNPKISDIKQATCEMFDLTKAEIEGPRKLQRIVYARHLAMFLCREMTDKSYPTIARSFGKRDHTSIMYAVERVTAYLEKRTDTPQHLDQLRERIYQLQR
ncbi:MAG: DnaA/Hda family protein [Hyphomonadaceae bacterium]|nr:DnaA/Hda family protein [Hyphomonadaceae bacterium]